VIREGGYIPAPMVQSSERLARPPSQQLLVVVVVPCDAGRDRTGSGIRVRRDLIGRCFDSKLHQIITYFILK